MPCQSSSLITLPHGNQLNREKSPDAFPRLCIYLLSRRITFMNTSEMVSEILSACTGNRQLVVASWNVHSFNLSFHIPWFQTFMNVADISYCDGSGILLAARYLGYKLPHSYRVAGGSDLIPSLLEHSDELSFFLLGARPTVLQAAVERLRLQYPGIKISGHHGYFDQFDDVQNAQVIQQINEMKPNILIVGMGMPIQEKWIFKHKDQLRVNAIFPCGAVIDRLAGTVVNCPEWIAQLGYEWLFRLCQEPRRLAARYLIGNLAFALQLILAQSTSGEPIIVLEEASLASEKQNET